MGENEDAEKTSTAFDEPAELITSELFTPEPQTD